MPSDKAKADAAERKRVVGEIPCEEQYAVNDQVVVMLVGKVTRVERGNALALLVAEGEKQPKAPKAPKYSLTVEVEETSVMPEGSPKAEEMEEHGMNRAELAKFKRRVKQIEDSRR